ncbi:hypothetical protein D3C85_792600 [compost metagenome]
MSASGELQARQQAQHGFAGLGSADAGLIILFAQFRSAGQGFLFKTGQIDLEFGNLITVIGRQGQLRAHRQVDQGRQFGLRQ